MKLVKIFAILLVLLIAAGLGGYIYFNNWYNNGLDKRMSTSTELVDFEVKAGEGSDSIAKNLEEAGLIDSATLYKLYLRRENKAKDIQAGKFKIPKNATIPEITELLSNAKSMEVVKVTIIEGYRSSQISSALDTKFKAVTDAKFKKSEFDAIVKNPDNYTFKASVQTFLDQYKPAGKSFEGFLYPDTYEFENDVTAQFVVETLVGHFIEKTKDIEKDSNFYNDLILASIVERESLTNEERPKIASVFTNRLRINIALESDATVNYATGKSNPRPTFEDLKVNSPYNTYKNPGLPPTPISNPRVESIEAAVEPADTDYYYFIHEQDGSGQVHFAKTLAEHNENVRKYLD